MSWDTADRTRASFTEAQEAVLGRIFCTSCQALVPRDGGRIKITANGRRRFVCASCVARLRSQVK